MQEGKTPLWQAASNGHTDVVRLLAEKGADVDRADTGSWLFLGRTPLWHSACNGHLDVVRLLVEKGADVNGSAGVRHGGGEGGRGEGN